MSATEKMDFFEAGDKTALICADDNVSEVVRTTLRGLNFKSHTVEASEAALERLRYTPYDIIVIQDDFAGSSLKSNPILSYLAPLAMTQRRNSMVVMIGSGLRTFDALHAFARSLQLVVNIADMPNFTAILKKSWMEFESMYRIYKDVFASLGEK